MTKVTITQLDNTTMSAAVCISPFIYKTTEVTPMIMDTICTIIIMIKEMVPSRQFICRLNQSRNVFINDKLSDIELFVYFISLNQYSGSGRFNLQ
jgi:hypothetical protein